MSTYSILIFGRGMLSVACMGCRQRQEKKQMKKCFANTSSEYDLHLFNGNKWEPNQKELNIHDDICYKTVYIHSLYRSAHMHSLGSWSVLVFSFVQMSLWKESALTLLPLMTNWGSMTLPTDFDILCPSSSTTKPWIIRFLETTRVNHMPWIQCKLSSFWEFHRQNSLSETLI